MRFIGHYDRGAQMSADNVFKYYYYFVHPSPTRKKHVRSPAAPPRNIRRGAFEFTFCLMCFLSTTFCFRGRFNNHLNYSKQTWEKNTRLSVDPHLFYGEKKPYYYTMRFYKTQYFVHYYYTFTLLYPRVTYRIKAYGSQILSTDPETNSKNS